MRFRQVWFVLFLACLLVPAGATDSVRLADIRQNLFSVCFAGERQAWVAGELGRVFRTTDGGSSFSRSPTETRDAFLSIACLPDGGIVVVGSNGLARRSADQGKTWKILDTGTRRNLLSVGFADARRGVAVGDYGTILSTEDGGDTWSPVALPAEIPLPEDIVEIVDPGDVLLYDVEFATAERAWIVGEFGVIFASSDGGRSWTAQKSPVETTLFGVGFADAENGWAVGIEEVMLRTRDGGNTWERQAVPERKGFVLALYDVAVHGRLGWAVGDNGMLLRTTDAGSSWQHVEIPIELAGNWFRGVAIGPGDEGLIVGGDGLMLATKGTEFRRLGVGS